MSSKFYGFVCSKILRAKPLSSVGSVWYWRTGGRWFDPRPGKYSFSRIYDSHCHRIHSSLIAVQCFDDGYMGQQPVAWKEYCAEDWLKELQQSMDKCTCRRDVT